MTDAVLTSTGSPGEHPGGLGECGAEPVIALSYSQAFHLDDDRMSDIC